MKVLDLNQISLDEALAELRRSEFEQDAEKEAVVRQIVADVRTRGDDALLELGRKFDCPSLENLEVTSAEWEQGVATVEPSLAGTLERAAARIRAFHERQRRGSWSQLEPGIVTGQVVRPMDRVGIYVPGGTAVYPSSLLMCALPAAAAGVSEIFVTTPCGKDGSLNPLVLLAARLAGVKRIFKVGGAQAIAALAYGTQLVPQVDKIAGPGNTYVNLAKRMVWGAVDIDLFAGPSEVCVVADETADPRLIAADVLTQAEHDAESVAAVFVTSGDLAHAVLAEVQSQLAKLPRAAILEQALSNSVLAICRSVDEAIALGNAWAPEHLALMVDHPQAHLAKVRNAGAVLLGSYSPQTLGDYMAGPSHTLPTSGAARFASPVDTDMFIKKMSYIDCSQSGLNELADDLVALAEAEGFEAHAQAVRLRCERSSGLEG